MHHIFISYSRHDAAWVEKLVAALTRRKLDVWIDRRGLPVSLPWLEEVRDAIEESRLFVVCDSASSRSSDACKAEFSHASKLAKPTCVVAVTMDHAEAVTRVLDAIQQAPPGVDAHTELAVRARDWHRSGRPRASLIGSGQRRRLVSKSQGFPRNAVTEAFVRASRRRSTQRAVIAVLGIYMTAVARGSPEALERVRENQAQANIDQVAAYTEAQAAFTRIDSDVYEGLALAARRNDDSILTSHVISAAIESPVPDDAFELPANGERFASTPVKRRVEVIDVKGRAWGRDADKHDQRTPKRLGRTDTIRRPANWAATTDGVSGIVHLTRHDMRHRTAVVSGAPDAIAFSPNEREVAIAVDRAIEVVDLGTGHTRLVLDGAPSAIADVAWSSDGRRIWALAGRNVVSWLRRQGTIVLDEPARSFRAMLPAADSSHAWLVSGDGEVRRLALPSGDLLETRTVHDELLLGASGAAGRTAALVGVDDVWLLPLNADRPARTLELNDCSPLQPDWSMDGTRLYVPCHEGPIIVFTEAGEVFGRIEVPGQGAQSVAVGPASDTLFVGSVDGQIYHMQGDRELTLVHQTGCGAPIRRIAVAADESAVLPVGDGTGLLSCSYVGLHTDGDWTWNTYVDLPEHANMARGAAFTPSGSVFGVGYADGTVILHPTENLLPSATIASVNGEIRDIFANQSGFYAATASGVVERLEICDACLTNQALAETAQQRLDRAIELGLTRPS